MAIFPAYAKVLFAGYGESFDPGVETTDMERGPPQEEVLSTQVIVSVQASILFRSAADAEAFETWYFDEIGRIGWFDLIHPRTGKTVRAKFPGGSIGTLVPLLPRFRASRRDLVIQYMR